MARPKKPAPVPMTSTSLKLPRELHKAAKILSVETDRSLSAVVAEWAQNGRPGGTYVESYKRLFDECNRHIDDYNALGRAAATALGLDFDTIEDEELMKAIHGLTSSKPSSRDDEAIAEQITLLDVQAKTLKREIDLLTAENTDLKIVNTQALNSVSTRRPNFSGCRG